jgi:hypothetical protein
MLINQIVWHRAEANSQTDLCGGQTAHQTEADGPTGPLWRSDRPLNRGWWFDRLTSSSLKSSRFYGQLILIMLINCIIIISWLIH